MAKRGTPKNTKNKAKHTKMMDRKKKKERDKKDASAARLLEAKEKMKAQKEQQ